MMQNIPDFIVRWPSDHATNPNALIQKSDKVYIEAESFAQQKVLYLQGYNALIKYIELAAEAAGEKPS